ncbi:MAG TPA: PLP-dependent aminotransferase family protein, partial [Verrucomicrobiota bacterium]|nr:PLP-dependent aminotransferase family protein [Verrucomicrobiota bacterium]
NPVKAVTRKSIASARMPAGFSRLARRTEDPAISWLMHSALARPKLISLAAGFTDNDSLPLEHTRALLNQLLRSRKAGRSALQYGSTQGDPALRRLTARRIERMDGRSGEASTDAERMIITHGSQQMLYMLTEALCDAGDIVLVEDPSYFVYLAILQSHGVQARGIAMEPDGVSIDALRARLELLRRSGDLPRVKLLYVVSYFQNPTGITTSLEKKKAILALLRKYERAAGHPIYLLEDAAYRKLRFAGKDIPSALSVDRRRDRVLYVGTYSKPFATGARVGFGILPEPVFTAVCRIKGNHDFGTSHLLQQLMARALSSGRYDRHLAELRKRYAHKASIMREAIRKHFPLEVQWEMPRGGLYFWARLPSRVSAAPGSRVFETALANDVLYVPGELCYADDPTRPKPVHEMRISFGSASERNIREGIRRLGQVLHQELTH